MVSAVRAIHVKKSYVDNSTSSTSDVKYIANTSGEVSTIEPRIFSIVLYQTKKSDILYHIRLMWRNVSIPHLTIHDGKEMNENMRRRCFSKAQ